MPDVAEQLSRYAAAAADSMRPVAVGSVRAAPRHRFRVPLVAAAVVLVVVAAAVLAWTSEDDPSSITTVDDGPATSEPGERRTSTTEDDAEPALGGAAQHDPAFRLEPEGPYHHGQRVMLTWPEGHVGDWANERPLQCAIVADSPDAPAETCGPLGGTTTGPGTSTQADVVLVQRIFTPTGYRDCADTTVTCRLLHRRTDQTYGATGPLHFADNPEPSQASLSVTVTDDPHEFVVDPDGLSAHPSWLDLRDSDPARAAGWPAFFVQVCAFGWSEADVAPYGTYLWLEFDSLSPDCDATGTATHLDPDDPNAPVTMTVPGRIHGYGGWSDCRVDHCFVQVRQTVVDSVDHDALTGHDNGVVAGIVPFDPTTSLPEPPKVEVLDPGPHTAGQTVAVEVSGLAEGTTTNVGACNVVSPWQCWYPAGAFNLANGTHRVTLPDSVASCGPDQCYLELDSQGEGLPPLATTPLDTGIESKL